MEEKIDAQTRKDPGASFVMDSGGPVISTWVAEERNRISQQELAEVEERVHADLAGKARGRELEAWEQLKMGALRKWALSPRIWWPRDGC